MQLLLSLLLTTSLFFHFTAAISVLVPLYIYPGANAEAWQPLLTSIEANPHIFYNVIVNPDSGPGSDHYPDANLIAGIEKLNDLPNVRTLGYVDTAYAKRDIALVNKDIDKYANWASFTNGNITVQGIFFDDVSSTDNQAIYHYYERLGDYTHTHDNHIPYVVFNPGAPAPAQLFSYCDTMVEFESPYNNYLTTFSFNDLPKSSRLRGQSAMIFTNVPLSADVQGLVGKLKSEGIGMVYMTSDCCYQVLNGGVLKLLAGAVTGA